MKTHRHVTAPPKVLKIHRQDTVPSETITNTEKGFITTLTAKMESE